MIRFISVAVFVVLFLILSIPLMIAEWIIGKFNMDVKNRSSLAIVNWAFRWCLRLSGVKITYIGEERVPRDQAVLYIGNHRSYFDILMTYVRLCCQNRNVENTSPQQLDEEPALPVSGQE